VGDNADFYPDDPTKWEEGGIDIVLFVLTAVAAALLGLLVYTGRKK